MSFGVKIQESTLSGIAFGEWVDQKSLQSSQKFFAS